jgi:hypothetical protein
MKHVFLAIGLSAGCALHAADPVLPEFRNQRTSVPPLSLAESIANGARWAKPFRFGTDLPRYSSREDSTPRSPDSAQRKGGHTETAPRISSKSGMPIFEPSDAMDYKLTIVPPDPSTDFKMVVKEPGPKWEPKPAK